MVRAQSSEHTPTAGAFPIRPGMDVFNADQTRYIGTVVGVRYGEGGGSGGQQESGPNPTGSETAPPSAPMVHEEGKVASTLESEGSRKLGEELGPVPTIGYGNRGPVNQSAGHEYATAETREYRAVRALVVRPGRINLGPLTSTFEVPAKAIRSISLERIVVDTE
jgi:hypothetical protein